MDDGVHTTSKAHDRFVETGAVAADVRPIVADSWRRSLAAGVAVDVSGPPLIWTHPELVDHRDSHPLSHVFPLLYDVLGRAAEECDSVMAVGDAEGRLMWVCGKPDIVALAETIGFVEGSTWDETHAGTNAPGTALALDSPLQIRSAEHFSRPVQPWSCAAAPVHHPLTQDILGVIDVTGGDAVGSPMVMGMVRAAARMAEAELGRLVAMAGGRDLWQPPTSGSLRIEALGRPDCQITLGHRTIRLSPRHSEIVTLLVDHPEGLSGDELSIALYEGSVRESTIRAEMTRLRSLLGPTVLDSRPYRLVAPLDCDWIAVDRLLESGDVAEAARRYRGPLLFHSEAPGVVARRGRIARRLHSAIIASADSDLMATWTRSRWGADDLEMWTAQLRLLPRTSPVRPLAEAEVARLNAEYGIPL